MKSEKPKIEVVLKRDGLHPVGRYDRDGLRTFLEDSPGQRFTLTPISDRNRDHLKKYWTVLGNVVEATGRFPTDAHLHNALKRACGYYTEIKDLDGSTYKETDSVAFSRMNQAEFSAYYRLAMSVLASSMGLDPETLEGE